MTAVDVIYSACLSSCKIVAWNSKTMKLLLYLCYVIIPLN